MTKKIAGIVFIFVCTSLAWIVLGTTIFQRTYSVGANLKERVVSTWGTAQTQAPPTAGYIRLAPKTEESLEDGKKVSRKIEEKIVVPLALESSRIDVSLDLEHRKKGLLWYSTYKVGFSGEYSFRNSSHQQEEVTFIFKYPASQAIYDNFTFSFDGSPLSVTSEKNSASAAARIPPGKNAVLRVGYRSQGIDRWNYDFGGEVTQVRDFALKMKTNFKEIDFADNTLSPSEKRETDSGWDLTWAYKSLVSGYQIGMILPEKLQPGPLAGRISFFAPVSLFFFFFLIFVITTLRGINLHSMNYFFLAAAFFSFHLLLAYLVDHLSIHTSFVICSFVSIFLVVSYLRLVLGIRFAAVEAGMTQLIYLVLFSYAFFFQGFTGLTITIGSILTLFVVMQMTGRIRWAEKFGQFSTQRVS